jgi:hypothetical protein
VSAELSPEARVFVDAARVARLATTTPEGRLHVVPICPALDGDRILISTEPTQKVRNLEADGHVGIAFDEYDEDWSKLRSVRRTAAPRSIATGPSGTADVSSCTRSSRSTPATLRSSRARR